VFEREMAYLLNRFQSICRMRDLTSVVLDSKPTEQQREDAEVDRHRSDESQKDESKNLDE